MTKTIHQPRSSVLCVIFDLICRRTKVVSFHAPPPPPHLSWFRGRLARAGYFLFFLPPLLLVVVGFSGKAWWLPGVTELGAIRGRVVDIVAMLLETMTIVGSVALLRRKGRAHLPVIAFSLLATLYLLAVWARGEEPDCICFGALQAHIRFGDSIQAGIARNLIALSMLGVSSFVYPAARTTGSDCVLWARAPARRRPA